MPVEMPPAEIKPGEIHGCQSEDFFWNLTTGKPSMIETAVDTAFRISSPEKGGRDRKTCAFRFEVFVSKGYFPVFRNVSVVGDWNVQLGQEMSITLRLQELASEGVVQTISLKMPTSGQGNLLNIGSFEAKNCSSKTASRFQIVLDGIARTAANSEGSAALPSNQDVFRMKGLSWERLEYVRCEEVKDEN
jgi:hypothetical protein